MSVIAEWAILESMLNGLFVRLMGPSADIGAAIYGALSGALARRNIFDATARISLTEEQYEVFTVIAQLAGNARADRNDLAHGVWGHCPDIKNGVLLIKATDLLAHDAASHNPARDAFNPGNFPVEKILVYYKADFRKTRKLINRLMLFTTTFMQIIANGASPSGQGLEQLAQEPEILEVLDRRRQKQSNQSALSTPNPPGPQV